MSVIGLGVVGGALYECLRCKNINVYGYDKFKNSDSFEDVLKTEIAFLSLPTLYDSDLESYNKTAIYDVCQRLNEAEYTGTVVLQSTVEPETTEQLASRYTSLHFIHSPEFISARTALHDMLNQKHVVLGRALGCSDEHFERVHLFYKTYFPNATISVCGSTESELMKIGVNSFYGVKVQYFNELFLICEKTSCNYECVKDMMLKNDWINPMHTLVPGTDGKLSFGGACLAKDIKSLVAYMKRKGTRYQVINATIKEQTEMRKNE